MVTATGPLALCALMAQVGCHVPAAEGSRLPVFERLYAIVGATLLFLYPVFYHHFLSDVATNWLPTTSTAFTIAAFSSTSAIGREAMWTRD